MEVITANLFRTASCFSLFISCHYYCPSPVPLLPLHGSPSGTLYIPGIYLHHRSFLPYSQPEPVLQLHSKYRIIALQRHPAATIHTAIPHETLRVRFISIVKALLHWAALANVMNIKKPCVLRLSLAHKMTNIRRCFVLIVRGILRGMV